MIGDRPLYPDLSYQRPIQEQSAKQNKKYITMISVYNGTKIRFVLIIIVNLQLF